MKEQKTKERFIELRAAGWSFDRIASELDVSKRTLIHWSQSLEIQISNLRAIELDALQEKYHLKKEQRIKIFGDYLEKVHQELLSRPLSDISTLRLVDVFLRLMEAQGQERVVPEFRDNHKLSDSIFDPLSETVSWSA